jgi:hypothetical protein
VVFIFLCEGFEDVWITVALKTLTSRHANFQKVAIHTPIPARLSPVDEPLDVKKTIGGELYSQWMDLDCILVQLWESHAIRLQVICSTGGEEKVAREFVEGLLPEMTKRGRLELVNKDGL